MATKKANAAKKSVGKKSVNSSTKTTVRTTKITAKSVATKPDVKTADSNISRPAVSNVVDRRRTLAERLTSPRVLGAAVAELIATFVLAVSVLVFQANALYVMFAYIAVVMMLHRISGGYANPALTIAAWVTRRMGAVRALGLIVAQVLGALLAFVVVSAYVQGAPAAEPSMYSVASNPEVFKLAGIPEGKEWFILGAEFLGAFILGLGIASIRSKISAAAVGLTAGTTLLVALGVASMQQVGLASMVGGGAILNPALAASTQALSWGLWPIVVYVVTPIVAATLAYALYDFLYKTTDRR